MPLIRWGPQYAVGHAEIDAQHIGLVDIINSLHDAMSQGRGQDAMSRIVHELDAYTRDHFATEESLMDRHGHPDAASHKEQHQDFIAAVFEIACKIEVGRAAVAVDTVKYLRQWLIGHVSSVDRKLADFVAAASKSSSD